MLKFKTFVIVVIVYIIAFIALKSNINLMYPYYLVKDFFYYPVYALEGELIESKELEEGTLLELQEEIKELKKINDISSTLSEYKSVKAVVIERNRMYWFNTITINKGSSSGIGIDMAVITGDGLIGKVNKVSKTTSEIKLITTNDLNSKISVTIKSGEDSIYGIMSGYDENKHYLSVTSTNKIIEIKEGSLVYTSGMGGVFPSGILIGKVVSIELDKYDVGRVINVAPSSTFSEIRFVNVLIRG